MPAHECPICHADLSETNRLRELCDDWDRYRDLLVAADRDEMCRAVLVEMRIELAKLAERCDYR